MRFLVEKVITCTICFFTTITRILLLVGAKIDSCFGNAHDLVLTCAEISWFFRVRSTHGSKWSKQWKLSRTVVAAFTRRGKEEDDMKKAAKLVLNGDVHATVPSIEEMVDFWTPILSVPSKEIEPKV